MNFLLSHASMLPVGNERRGTTTDSREIDPTYQITRFIWSVGALSGTRGGHSIGAKKRAASTEGRVDRARGQVCPAVVKEPRGRKL